mmetsp:Transcript_19205/g.41731  ORF Transcript_19205/g.41731 Transcript_19205/m.41731 type:complete len:172 (+) Transcript_19205:160-675(+)|eukprot:CAMPEP_0168193650 /NCGR_PEP_ID=MMETSP0139_2-20121125/18725_1 /TAXON_ID=44445 /ORGANISM="Pseudo-nitzschia australis, Strain 10249 10 AB" /LENGTH=171 /DNA_ID=CAMNT_0008117031 /DNA_START=96 /DNA_END=611 /DNA_ORIENTATION=-
MSSEHADIEEGVFSEDESESTFLCCGICDMRVGTIFVNGFNIAAILVGALVTGIESYMFWKSIGGALAAGLPGLILSGVGLYAAKNFDLRATYLATAGFFVILLVDGILMQWFGLVLNTIVIFPHAVLAVEMQKGIITKENYTQQKYLSPQGVNFVDRMHSQYIAPTPTTN